MKLLQMVKEQSLIGESQPMREAEERRTDHHHGRANRAKRSGPGSTKRRRARSTKRRRPSRAKTVTKEKAPPGEAEGMETEFPRKAERMEGKSRVVKVVMWTKELFMSEMLLMAEGHKRPKVIMWAEELLVLEVIEMARPPMKAACVAPHAKSSDPMGPGPSSKEHSEKKDDECHLSLFHRSPS
jgi:hypothetical protein